MTDDKKQGKTCKSCGVTHYDYYGEELAIEDGVVVLHMTCALCNTDNGSFMIQHGIAIRLKVG